MRAANSYSKRSLATWRRPPNRNYNLWCRGRHLEFYTSVLVAQYSHIGRLEPWSRFKSPLHMLYYLHNSIRLSPIRRCGNHRSPFPSSSRTKPQNGNRRVKVETSGVVVSGGPSSFSFTHLSCLHLTGGPV